MPELWHPDTGVIEPAPVWSAQDGRTTVQLTLNPLARYSSFSATPRTARITSSPPADDFPPESSGGAASWKFNTPFMPPLMARARMDVTAKLCRTGQRRSTGRGRPTTMLCGHDPARQITRKELARGLHARRQARPCDRCTKTKRSRCRQICPSGRRRNGKRALATDGSPVVKTLEQWPGRIAHGGRKSSARRRDRLPAPQEIAGAVELKFPAELGRAAIGHAGQTDFLDRPHRTPACAISPARPPTKRKSKFLPTD